MDTKLILYNREVCPHCKVVREKLSQLELTYLCVNVNPDKTKRTELYKISGQDSIPTLVIEGKAITGEEDIMEYLQTNYNGVTDCHNACNSCGQ